MNKTKIDWADMVWNPTTGCTKVSAGCKNCYAEGIAQRFWGKRKFSDVQCHEDRLNDPLKVKKPSKIFVNSMSDLFHPDVPDGFIFGCFMRMVEAKQHTFIILTKRPMRMANWIRNSWMTDIFSDFHPDLVLKNVWLGVSIEDQDTADERIEYLSQTPAAIQFVSYEPALNEIDISPYLRGTGLDWVIAGAETGTSARPCNPDWLRSVRDQCADAGVPFFLKQTDKYHNHMLDGKEWHQFPEVKS